MKDQHGGIVIVREQRAVHARSHSLFVLKLKPMNRMQKSFIAAAAAASMSLGSFGAVTAFAAEQPVERADKLGPIVSAIATKFHLSEHEVKAVFEEQRAKMQAERKAMLENRLAERVASGKITQEQADKIKEKINKHPGQRKHQGRPENFRNN